MGFGRESRGMTDPDTIRQLLDQYQTSGLTQREFAVQNGLAYSTFTSWLGKARAAASTPTSPQWIEAPPVHRLPGPGSNLSFVLEWPQGLKLHVPVGFDDADLGRLLEVIAIPCLR